jgi:hypothetical protein
MSVYAGALHPIALLGRPGAGWGARGTGRNAIDEALALYRLYGASLQTITVERMSMRSQQTGDGSIMDDKKIERSLNRIGKACFVTHYELFRDKARTEPPFVVDYLMKTEKYNESGATIRASYAKQIFNAGRHVEALKIVARSERIPQESASKARMLLNE